MLQIHGQCYHVIRMHLQRSESIAKQMDRTGLKILENNKNIQSIISVNTNILLRRFRLKFLRIMCSTSCYKERVNFENTLYFPPRGTFMLELR
jgi:hypothetical protein